MNVFNHFETVRLGKVTFKIKQPTILDLDRMEFDLETDESTLGLLSILDDKPLKTLSKAISKRFHFLIYWYIRKFASWEQIKDAYIVLHGVVFGKAIFKAHNLDEVQSKEIDIAGGRTIYGKIPTYCEYLNFTLNEVLTTPYPVLLLMIADKQRTLGEDDVVKVRMNAKDLMNERT